MVEDPHYPSLCHLQKYYQPSTIYIFDCRSSKIIRVQILYTFVRSAMAQPTSMEDNLAQMGKEKVIAAATTAELLDNTLLHAQHRVAETVSELQKLSDTLAGTLRQKEAYRLLSDNAHARSSERVIQESICAIVKELQE